MTCDYCGAAADLVGGQAIYPHRPDLWTKRFWRCRPCRAYVGCHRGTDRPLGRLANAQLRMIRGRAHACFDPLWRDGSMNRADAYAWLARQLDIEPDRCHIGMFDVEQCRAVIRLFL
jgi:hypothetical protein